MALVNKQETPGAAQGVQKSLHEMNDLSWAAECSFITPLLSRYPALQNSPCDPCCVHCFLHQCALCQEHREMKHRLTLDDAPLNLAPPTEQEMTPDIKHTAQPQ